MNKNWLFFLIGIIAFVFLNSVFIVDQWKQAIVFQFGQSVRLIKEPGLHFKIPLVQNVRFFDIRILNYNLKEKEILASDEKRMIVSAFIKYRIINALEFYKTIGTEDLAASKLYSILDSSLRQIVGRVPLSYMLTEKRIGVMQDIAKIVEEKSKRFGIDIIDVRILRADLPKENSEAVYRRMQSEREKEAKEFRSEGLSEADKIKAQADKEARLIIAEAKKNAQILKGEGDSIAAKIYANAYNKDPEFYEFYKSMNSYKHSFKNTDTKIILTPDNKFMKFFNNSK